MITYFFSLPFFFQVLLFYILIINIITFFYFGIDKIKSQMNTRRVSEKMLWFLVGIGGTIGGLIAMNFFRHKTKKLSFQLGFFLILLIQIGLCFLLYYTLS